MGAPPDADEPRELAQLREAGERALRESLGGPDGLAALEAAADGDAARADQLRELYAVFEALVAQTAAPAVDAWVEQRALAPRIAAVARARQVLEHAGGDEAAAAGPTEAGFRADLLAAKRAQLEKAMAAIEEEEKRTAHLRVELAQQKDVIVALSGQIRARETALGDAVAPEK